MIKVNSTRTAVVDQTRYWLPVNSDTPRGVKMLLLTRYGVAHIGHYTGHIDIVGWAALPKIPEGMIK